MAAISQKNIFIKVKNSFIRLYLNKLLDSENGTKNKKASRGANFWNEVRSLDGYILGMVNSLKLKFSGFSFHRVCMDHNHKVSGKSVRVTMETFEKLGDLI